MTPRIPKVFISYSHDSDEHAARVLVWPIACGRKYWLHPDRYYEDNPPPEGCTIWMMVGSRMPILC